MTEIDHVHWLSKPTMRNPVMISAFTGWNDAADAASTAVRTLIEAWSATPLAEINPEDFTDFASTRPIVRLKDGVTRTIVWPTVTMWHASTPGSDVILVLGPEPSLRWRLFTEQILSVASHFNASMMISLGALLADVPHNKPIQLIGTASDSNMIERFDLQRSQYEGPTGILGVLLDACNEASLPSASLWAAVPAYASQIPSPKAAAALISRTGEIIGTPAPVGLLQQAIETYERRVNQIVDEDEDLAAYVERLDSSGEGDYEDDEDEDDGQMSFDFDEDNAEVSAASLADEVEQFLRDQEKP
ncbi:MAG: PAC2 family protein [Ilumatobacteraceae bacterium]|nr:PAC2 family protein [Ilumatobacteraceae bacterium]MBJ7368547.1 PAC2 family protein [Ilumatobacteraceae bacterium]